MSWYGVGAHPETQMGKLGWEGRGICKAGRMGTADLSQQRLYHKHLPKAVSVQPLTTFGFLSGECRQVHFYSEMLLSGGVWLKGMSKVGGFQ